MFSVVEALNYRCLRYIRQEMDRFHVLVGPNASGKTTFLDVIAFLGQFVTEGLDAALDQRSRNFEEMLHNRQGTSFELAVEAPIPQQILDQHAATHRHLTHARYEISVGMDPQSREVSLTHEAMWLCDLHKEQTLREKFRQRFGTQVRIVTPRTLFPEPALAPESLFLKTRRTPRGAAQTQRRVLSHRRGGNANYYSEIYGDTGKGWVVNWRLKPGASALGNAPEDEQKLPVAVWFKQLLKESVQSILLDSLKLRHASPPGKGTRFLPDGSNLPWVVGHLLESNRLQFHRWLEHVCTALPDVRHLSAIDRPEDKHKYLQIEYDNNLRVPSWFLSDGTLRLLALTIMPYLTELTGVMLVEEPENGIHPQAVATVLQSLSSVYNAQLLLATHSPIILSQVEPSQVLCFAKKDGATDIVAGDQHPRLKEWQSESSLGDIFAAGVLS